MAEFEHDRLYQDMNQRTGPYGDVTMKDIVWDTSAFALNDSIVLMNLPQDCTVHNVLVIVNDPHTGSTIDVGHKQHGNAPVESWVDDPDYFMAARSIAARTTVNSVDTVRHLPLEITADKVALTATLKGAAIAAKTIIGFQVFYRWTGRAL